MIFIVIFNCIACTLSPGYYKRSAMWYRLSLIFLALTILLCNPVNAQQPGIAFQHLDISQGLSQNTVYAIHQDKKGFIWIGTGDGLNRYDGYVFRLFGNSSDTRVRFPSSVINAITEDKSGKLLIGTTEGICIFDPAKESVLKVEAASGESGGGGNHITSIRTGNDGTIWVGTLRGIKKYDAGKNALVDVSPTLAKGQQLSKTYTIAEDSAGVLWAGWGNGLLRYNKNAGLWELVKEISVPNTVRALTNNGNKLWIATESAGFYSYEGGRLHEAGSPGVNATLRQQLIRALLFDGDKAWIACREGLYIADTGFNSLKRYTYIPEDPLSISQNSLLCITKDRAGSIWIGTFSGGIDVVHPGADNFFSIKVKKGNMPGLSHKIAGNVLEGKTGEWWIATSGGGLNKYNPATGVISRIPYPGRPVTIDNCMVKSLAKDDAGNIYAGMLDGLAVCRKGKTVMEPVPLRMPGSAGPDKHINALAWNDGIIWAGTNGNGLIGMDRDGKQVILLNKPSDASTIPSNVITSLLSDRSGGLWVGTQHGLAYKPKGSHQFIRILNRIEKPDIPVNPGILSLTEDKEGLIWIGTNGKGLICYDRQSNHYIVISTRDGLPNAIVHGIQQDFTDNFWISTNKGISCLSFVNKKYFFNSVGHKITNYTEKDGLSSNGFLGQGMFTSSGYMVFGSLDGISIFRPGQIRQNRQKPDLVFTNFLQNSRPVDIWNENAPLKQAIHSIQHITLKHDQAFFSIEFSALNYINTEKNVYAIKMDGLKGDDSWHLINNKHEATYTNLEPGNYLLQVKAANNDGIWNETPVTLSIKVLPPWWKTWWAYLLYALVIAALLYLFYRFSFSNSMLKHNLSIERISHEKDKELAERKLDFFTHISHEIKTPLTLILAPMEKILHTKSANNRIMNQLMIMKRNGERLQRLIEQMLDYRKLDAGVNVMRVRETNIVPFCQEVLLSFEQFAAERNIQLEFNPSAEAVKVWIDTEKMEKVIYNLLSNAVKFTRPGDAVGLLINEDPAAKTISIAVTDTGVGIPAENLPLLFQKFRTFHEKTLNPGGSGIGLAYAKELVELHAGKITVESHVADGTQRGFTKFTVILKAGNVHFDQAVVEEGNVPVIVESLPFEKKLLYSEGESKPVLLLVEDNPELLHFLSVHLSANFLLYTAADGNEGWSRAVELLPDIIISDVMMPGMSGTELCRKIKTDERTSHIPVILLTARTSLLFKIEGIETGADDYITKPFSLAFVDARIRNLLESRRKLRERYSSHTQLPEPADTAFTAPDEAFLQKVVQFIDDNLQETTLNVEEMARSLAMSRMTLYRKITALTNQSPLEFIRSVRLKRACGLLALRQYTVNEVAYMVGFGNVDYFRRAFREHTGHTPTEYIDSLDVTR
jgi:signal transduction histidine kinase/ligand-binding sensor domain-containing protein/DNA-binding response OmpR family regulator